MKVIVYCINEGTASQYFGLKSADDGFIIPDAPNNWKTKRGAINWARKNGLEIA